MNKDVSLLDGGKGVLSDDTVDGGRLDGDDKGDVYCN